MRILIVDDEIEVAKLLAEAVKSQGHEAAVANDGQEGLRILGEHRPDAVFLDVWMEGMSGIEVLRRIRTSDPTLPVVVLTGHALTQELDEARRLGVTEVLEKPFILSQLSGALANLKTPTG